MTGNRISTLTNSGTNGSGATYTAFTYDANGNTTHDGRTGHDLSWNMLNLISGVSATSGGSTTQLASYNWFADGSKYSALRADGSGYVYKGDLVYERSAGGTLSLDCVLTTGGRIVANKNSSGTITGYTVYHHITDHLGSVRAITNASTGNVVETSDFLPFGTRWSQTSGSSSSTLTDATNRWRYSGKEEQKTLNSSLPLIDYGARMYDPTIARWMSMDPMTEKYYPMSPYGYCAGNPESYIDKYGDIIIYINGYQGKWTGAPGEGGKKYWKPNNSFTIRATQVFHDDKSLYPDIRHNFFSSAKQRRKLGYTYAQEHFAEITQDIDEGEKVRFVSHSMGAAFAEGMADYLISAGVKVDVLVHFEAYQADEIESNGRNGNILTIDFQDKDDLVINIIGAGDINGADHKYRTTSHVSFNQKHVYHIRREESWDVLSKTIEAFLKE